MKVVVYGAGEYGRKFISRLKNDDEVVAVADNYKSGFFLGGGIVRLDEAVKREFDYIVICLNDYTNLEAYSAIDEMIEDCHRLGVSDEKIKLQNVYYEEDDCRIKLLEEFCSTEHVRKSDAAVAECGVFRGHFAHYISKYFPDNRMYLFDTFSGLDKRDIDECPTVENAEWLRTRGNIFLKNGNEEIALRRCFNRERIIVKKGFVPDTFESVDDGERFIFVNLDMDVYKPMLAALNYFSERMVCGGLILCHDYFAAMYPGIKLAVDSFKTDRKYIKIPTADSMAIVFL